MVSPLVTSDDVTPYRNRNAVWWVILSSLGEKEDQSVSRVHDGSPGCSESGSIPPDGESRVLVARKGALKSFGSLKHSGCL